VLGAGVAGLQAVPTPAASARWFKVSDRLRAAAMGAGGNPLGARFIDPPNARLPVRSVWAMPAEAGASSWRTAAAKAV